MYWGRPVVLASFTENKILSVSNYLGIKNQFTVNVRVYFWTLEFCSTEPCPPSDQRRGVPPFQDCFPQSGPVVFACESLDLLGNFAGTALPDSS